MVCAAIILFFCGIYYGMTINEEYYSKEIDKLNKIGARISSENAEYRDKLEHLKTIYNMYSELFRYNNGGEEK